MKTLQYQGPAGTRMDHFLLRAEPELTPALYHKYLRQNKIKLNGRRPAPEAELNPGDELRLYLPRRTALPLQVLLEDEHLLAVTKPAGLPSEAGTGDSLLARARAYLSGAVLADEHPAQEESQAFLPQLCHRLDTGTSGVVLLAKTPEFHTFALEQFKQHRMQKTYYGVCVGQPRPPAATITSWLYKDTKAGRVFSEPQKTPGAKQAETAYETLAVSGRLSLLALRPRTGRTHQIRAQLAAAGTPLLGDSKYGKNRINRELRCKYQCLCAAELAFPLMESGPFHHLSGRRIRCQSPWFYQQVIDGRLR